MRKTLLLAMIVLVFAAWAVAQQGTAPPSPQSKDSQTSEPATGDSIDGCLGGSASNFTVTDKAGTTYQLQLPKSADPDKLNQHVGAEVRVTGTRADAAGGASGNQASIHVTRMDKIADTCGASSGANPSK